MKKDTDYNVQNKDHMDCRIKLMVKRLEECNEDYIPRPIEYEFDLEKGICYLNNKYYGKIISWNDELIIIEVDNGNKYMKGLIRYIYKAKPYELEEL